MKAYFVAFESPVTNGDVARIEAAGGAVQYVYDLTPSVAAYLPAAAVRDVEMLPGVERISPADGEVHALSETQWGVSRIEAPVVWANEGNRAAGIKVAILDSGIDLDHPDLAANIVGGITFAPDSPADGQDNTGHGTHVAGIVAARSSGTGVVGAAPQAQLLAVKVLGADGRGRWIDVAAGINWAKNAGAKVINMSLGSCAAGTSPPPEVEIAINAAYTAGIVLVAAGGSGTKICATQAVEYPARYPNVIAVAGTNTSDGKGDSRWSAGPEIEVAAPGVVVPSTWLPGAPFPPGGGCTSSGLGSAYANCTGTSMASPHVAGTAALMLAEFPWRTPLEVRERLRFSTSRNNTVGYGVVNASKSATNNPFAAIVGPVCLTEAGSYLYTAETTGGGGGNAWKWYRDPAPFGDRVYAGSGQSRSFFFAAGSYGERLEVEVRDRWGKTSGSIFQVYMDSGSGLQLEGAGTDATICGGGGSSPPME